MADVKLPNISNSNNNSFIEPKSKGHGDYEDSSSKRNGGDGRSQSFHSGRGISGPGMSQMGRSGVMEVKKQRKE